MSSIRELAERFRLHREHYLSHQYNETQLRREFIDPLFKLLGWDVDNEHGYAAPYKDVIHEEPLKMGKATKAPDYTFKIATQRKFFVETKRPSVNIKNDPASAYQLRRYGWSAKLPLSILTDFEEFAVYDCRIKPEKDDKASKARIFYFTLDDLVENWEQITAIFSKEAVLKGSFDKYAQSQKGKQGTAEVDAEFLEAIEGWRLQLARNLALRNTELTQRDLNFAVQTTIDRLIFLRICEDRGIEHYGRLQELADGKDVYDRLKRLFEEADEKYNAGLFARDPITPEMTVDDEVIKKVIKSFYYPESPYEFSVLPAFILGSVYEQFLGKVIKITPARRIVVEEKPEVRKAGGVYYTPEFIVDHMVEFNLGRLLHGKTPKQAGGEGKGRHARPVRIIDPACGSGSFLIRVYQFMLDWYRERYIEDGPDKWAKGRTPRLYQHAKEGWALTMAERKRILLTHIYGVDLDPQAVEVTKLSLLLKALEGESDETLKRQFALFHERVLPNLEQNIKCGNALIGSDFYQLHSIQSLEPDELYRINAFDWAREFPGVFQEESPGFSLVIGNPPWISLSGKFGVDLYTQGEVQYLIDKYHGNTYMPNMYEYFVAKGLDLTHENGLFSFIVPDRLGFNEQFVGLRKRILEETQVEELLYKVPFPGVVADTLVFSFRQGEARDGHEVRVAVWNKEETMTRQEAFLQSPQCVFQAFENRAVMELIQKVETHPDAVPLSPNVCATTSGFGGKSKLITEQPVDAAQIPVYKGESIGRYRLDKTFWFDFKRENITGRTTDRRKLGAVPKILLRKTGNRIIATYDESGVFPEQSLYFLYDNRTGLDMKFLLGVINSGLLNFYYRHKLLTNKESIAQVKKKDLDTLPIPLLDLADSDAKQRHDKVVELVDTLLHLNEQLKQPAAAHTKNLLQRQLEATEQAIDGLVCDLFDLTPQERELLTKKDLST